MSGDWNRVRLGDISSIDYGYTAKASFEEIGPKFLRITDLQNGSVDWSEVPSCEISDVDLRKHKLLDQDIVFARTGATTGKSYLVSEPPEAIAASYLIRLRLNAPKISAKYVSLYFQTDEYWSLISAGISGSAQGGFNASKLADIPFPVPSLPEQKRIVAILDEAFAGIAAATANAEKNLANARELFEGFVSTIFESNKNDWHTGRLETFCERITKGSSPTWQGIKYVDEPGVLFVTSENVGENAILLDRPKYVEEAFNEKDQKSILKPGDVLTNIVGASIGRTAVFNREELANINQAVCLIRCIPELLSPTYISYLLNSPYFRKVLHENEVDNARANLSLSFFRNLEIPAPPRAFQETVGRVPPSGVGAVGK